MSSPPAPNQVKSAMMVRVGSLPRFEGETPPSPPRQGTRQAEGCLPAAAVPNQLAVKVYRTGHSSDRGDGSAMREVMWEVHVLRQLRHEHVVRLSDVIEMADAVYVVMERLEGPDLHAHIHAQPGGVLAEAEAARYFAHVLGALCHAHARGFLHCDVKPANVRLDRGCERAVLVDWGMARKRENQPGGSISQGTPAYASPEQLTGYNPSSMVSCRL